MKKGRKKKKGESEQQFENIILKTDVGEKIDLEANERGKQKIGQINKEDEKLGNAGGQLQSVLFFK